jgi:hypothetical protein
VFYGIGIRCGCWGYISPWRPKPEAKHCCAPVLTAHRSLRVLVINLQIHRFPPASLFPVPISSPTLRPSAIASSPPFSSPVTLWQWWSPFWFGVFFDKKRWNSTWTHLLDALLSNN